MGARELKVQAECATMHKDALPPALPIIRRRISSWKIGLLFGRVVERVLEVIESAWKVAPPRTVV
eukprot:4146404-Lingulodinium_polyedra.AAC.1